MNTINITYYPDDLESVKKTFDTLMVWYNKDLTQVLAAMNQNAIAVANQTAWHNQINTKIETIKVWAMGAIMERGKQCSHNGVVFNIVQTHTVTNPSFTPPTVASLYRPAPVTVSGNLYPTWNSIGVLDSVNNWKQYDRVFWNANNWESVVNNNVWEPGVVGTNIWKLI